MANDEEYRQLQEAARDALYELLRYTEPGTGIQLHQAYAELQRSMKLEDLQQEKERILAERQDAREVEQRRALESLERHNAWKRTTRAERHHRILNALGDDRLTASQLMMRLRETHSECDVHESHLRVPLLELLERGEVDRVREPRGNSATAFRWRWHRRAELSMELRDLQRMLENEEA